jgi:hypothetical protein
VVVRGDFGETEGKTLATAALLAAACALTLPSQLHLERRRLVALAAPAIAATGVAFAMLMAAIWGSDLFEDTSLAKTTGSIVVAAFAMNHVALLLFARPKQRFVAVLQWATLALVGAMAGMLIAGIWRTIEEDGYWRVAAVVGILDALGSILTPLLSRLWRPSGGPGAEAATPGR